jgi:hypothetical protein
MPIVEMIALHRGRASDTRQTSEHPTGRGGRSTAPRAPAAARLDSSLPFNRRAVRTGKPFPSNIGTADVEMSETAPEVSLELV